MKQSDLPALIITMAAEVLIRAEETHRPIDDELIKRIMGRHGPFEQGSFGYHLRTLRVVCKKPTQFIRARCDALKTEQAIRRHCRTRTDFDPRLAQLPPSDRE